MLEEHKLLLVIPAEILLVLSIAAVLTWWQRRTKKAPLPVAHHNPEPTPEPAPIEPLIIGRHFFAENHSDDGGQPWQVYSIRGVMGTGGRIFAVDNRENAQALVDTFDKIYQMENPSCQQD